MSSIEVSEAFQRAVGEAPISGPDPARRTDSPYATFSDPDGNGWLLQQGGKPLPS